MKKSKNWGKELDRVFIPSILITILCVIGMATIPVKWISYLLLGIGSVSFLYYLYVAHKAFTEC